MKKLLLIAILMLALVITAVACTTDPVTEETTPGDTTVETPTEAPTAEPDQPTEEPTTPVEDPTEAPTAEPTEPATTEEPTEPATTEEPTEAPTADPAEPVLKIEPDFINTQATSTVPTVANQVGSTEVITEGNRTFVRLTANGGDPYVAIIPLNSNYTLPQYMAISYRTNSAVGGQFFMGSGQGWNGQGDVFSVDWTEGDWGFMVIDLTQTGLTSITDGLITYARMDFFAGDAAEGDYFDVQYVAFFNTVEYALAYDFEMTKAPMWDENKDVVMHQNFDQFYLGDGHQDDAVNNNLNFYHAVNKPDWDKVADITASDYNALTYWGWIVLASETIGQFGYQVNMDAPIFDDAWTHATEQPVIDAAINAGGATGTRMKIAINTTDFDGETTVRVLYKDAEGNTVCLNEITVIAPVKAKDITNTFVSDLASNAVDTTVDATDLSSYFQFGLNLGDYKTSESAYKINGISEMFADVNGKYFIKTNFASTNPNSWAVVRGYRVVNSDEIIEKFDPAAGFYKINNYYETDSAGACGGAGIYARADGVNLTVMIKYYNTETATRVGNKVYTIAAEGTELTMADDGETVYIMVNGTTYMTIALNGSVVYEDINEVSPKNGFAATATVTLADGTTETIENTLIAETCECQVAMVVRSGDLLFTGIEVGAFSAIEIPGFPTVDPDAPQEPKLPMFDGRYHANVDHINGKGPNGEANYNGVGSSKVNSNGSIPVRNAADDGIVVNEDGTVTVGGWMAVAGGINHYAYTVNGGELIAAVGGVDGEPLEGYYTQIGVSDAIKNGRFGGAAAIVADLSAYAGQTVTVTFYAVPETAQDTVAPIVAIADLVVPAAETPAA